MAFFNDLVRVIAAVEGMEEMTVRGIGLSVRDAGHITKGGRGLSAATMTTRDAANFLIGVNGSTTAKDAGNIVSTYRKALLLDRLGFRKSGTGKLFDAAKSNSEFGNFFECMIDFYREGIDLGPLVVGAFDYDSASIKADLLSGKAEKALDIEFVFQKPHRSIDVIFKEKNSVHSATQLWFDSIHDITMYDRKDKTYITAKTLEAVAKTLNT